MDTTIQQLAHTPTTVSKETYYSVKRDLLQWGDGYRYTAAGAHAYYSVKRDLLQCQKRPTTVGRWIPLYSSWRARLLQCQKRPTTVSKETYYSGEMDTAIQQLARTRFFL
jgi:hypothetical protein